MALFIALPARAVIDVLQRPVARAVVPRSLYAVARVAAPLYAARQARTSKSHYRAMLSADQRGAFSTTAAAGAAPVVTQPIVHVKIGVDGNDRSLSLTYDALIRMDAAVLLRFLKADEAFSTELKDVPLGKCTVWLLPRVAADEPTPQEEAAAVELRAAATIGELLAAQKWSPSRLLFLRVRTPPSAAAAALWSGWTPLAPETSVAMLISAIRNEQYTEREDGHIELTHPDKNCMWPDLYSKLLFVRTFYQDLNEHVLASCSDTKMMYQLTGQPGIGKSAFGLYVLFRALKAGRPVVYAADKLNECYSIAAASADAPPPAVMVCDVVQHNIAAKSPLLRNSRTVYILDGCRVQAHDCATLQVASPRLLSIISTVDKTNNIPLTELVMPVYTRAELLQLRALAFKNVPEAEAKYRMSFWGAIPRLALAWSANRQLRRVQRVKAVDVSKVMLQEVGDVATEEVRHSVFIQHCAGQAPVNISVSSAGDDPSSTNNRPSCRHPTYYMPGPIVWSSWPVMHHVLKRATDAEAAKLLASVYVAQSVGESITRVLSGDMFERLATYILHRGGSFQLVRSAPPNSHASFSQLESEAIQVQASDESMSFASVSELPGLLKMHEHKSSFVLHASKRNECAVDGVIKTRAGKFCSTGNRIAPAVIDFAFVVPLREHPRFKNIHRVECDNPTAHAQDEPLVRAALRQHIIMLPTGMQRVETPQPKDDSPPAAVAASKKPDLDEAQSLDEFAEWLQKQAMK